MLVMATSVSSEPVCIVGQVQTYRSYKSSIYNWKSISMRIVNKTSYEETTNAVLNGLTFMDWILKQYKSCIK